MNAVESVAVNMVVLTQWDHLLVHALMDSHLMLMQGLALVCNNRCLKC